MSSISVITINLSDNRGDYYRPAGFVNIDISFIYNGKYYQIRDISSSNFLDQYVDGAYYPGTYSQLIINLQNKLKAIPELAELKVADGGAISNLNLALADGSIVNLPVKFGRSITITDTAGKKFSNVFFSGNTVQGSDSVDSTWAVTIATDPPPSVTLSSGQNILKAGESFAVNITLDEASTNFTASDLRVTNGIVTSFTGAGTTYRANVTPTANFTGSLSITVPSGVFTDSDGNANADGAEANNTLSIKVDTAPPTVNTFSPSTASTGVPVGANIAITFSETIQRGAGSIVIKTAAGATFATFDIASSGNIAVSGSTLTIDPPSDFASGTSYQLVLPSGALSDTAGNPYAGTGTYTFTTVTVDTTPPTIAVSANKTVLKSGDTATMTFTLSEPSLNFVSSDVQVAGGTLSNFTGAGTSYTATLTPGANGNAATTITVTVPNGAFTDAAGNANVDGAEANNTVTLSVDTVAPTARTFTPADGAAKVAVDKPPAISVTFSEAVRLAGTAILKNATTGAVIQSFKAGDAGVTISGDTITFTPQRLDTMAGHLLEFGAAAVTDLAGNAYIPSQTYDFSTASSDNLYLFFVMAFSAAPGGIFLGQLAEAWNSGMPLRTIVDVYTTKEQFQSIYPARMSNLEFATALVNNVVRSSAPPEIIKKGISDIRFALDFGLPRGEVIYNVMGSIATKPATDPPKFDTFPAF